MQPWSLAIIAVCGCVAALNHVALTAPATSVAEPLGCGDSPSYETVNTDNLEAVFVFMRHGVRAPWTTYPKDPNVNNTNRWPNGRSQLTSFGIKQATSIGNLLAKRYGPFTKNLKRAQIYLRASAAQRCLDTLNLVSSRLWPKFDEAHKPVIYSLPKEIDSVLYEEPHCPIADKDEANNMNDASVSKYENLPEIKELYSYVADQTGLPPNMSGVTKAFDCVRCEKINGYKIPKWASINNIYDRMGQVYTKNLNFLYSSEKSRRLRAGPILQEVIDTVKQLRTATPDTADSLRRAYIYTTHDYKISALLLALGEPLNEYLPFAATVIFEVRRNPAGNDFDIKSYYISQTEREPYNIDQLRLNKCLSASDFQCRFGSFVNYLKPYENVTWTKECGLTDYDAIQAAEDNIGSS